MKPFWKKVNRGLLLGAALLLALIVLIVVQTISFRKAKPVIREEVRSYVSDLISVTFVTGEEITPGANLTEDQKQARRDKFEKVIETHWQEVSEKELSSGSILNGGLTGLDSTRAWFENSLLGKKYPIDKLNLPILMDADISVTANGSGYAVATVSWFSFSYISDETEVSGHGYLQLELKRVNGNWKIIAASVSLADESETMGGPM